MIQFFIPGPPPRVTKQMKKTIFARGRVMHIDTPELKEATSFLQEKMLPFRPRTPLAGPVKLIVVWVFPHLKGVGKATRESIIYKDTAPDLGNMEKLFADVMEDMGFFANDGQVSTEGLVKVWGPTPGIAVSAHEIKGPVEEWVTDLIQEVAR
ncbi:MAG TPA: RusA family crossover junction endodeoxyribonuclease [Chthoniobacteraceae bacterium]|nr:RusA family crossover junction endodeoxyribonuclease [Chthoniobacteraceae bacterium]